MFGSIHRRVPSAVLALALLAIGLPGAVLAAEPPARLSGEALISFTPRYTQIECNPEGESVVSYEVTATHGSTAYGPYPGTFRETGRFTFGPQVGPLVSFGDFGTWHTGQVTSFQASFTIESTAGTVTGTKTLHPSLPSVAQCAVLDGDDTVGIFSEVTGELTYMSISATYVAQIHVPGGGSWQDRGRSSVSGYDQDVWPAMGRHYDHQNFNEGYTSTGPLEPIGPAFVELNPPAAVNPVGTQHTVTATALRADGEPAPNVIILFSVSGATETSGSCWTGAQGACDFTYTGPPMPGTDAISACADTNDNGAADATEPCGAATKTWVALPPASVTLSPAASVNPVGTQHTVTASVTNATGGSVSDASVLFTVNGSTTTSGSCTTDATGQCDYTYAGPQTPGADVIAGCADSNNSGATEAAEPCGAATKTWVALPPASVTLSPAASVNPVGTQHTVTASVTNATGGAVSDASVLFTVRGSSTTSGSCSTNAAGQCDFTYTGPVLSGADVIVACADTDNDGIAEIGEPCGEAIKAWILPASTPGQVTGGGYILDPADGEKVSFGFNAKGDSKGIKGNCTVVDAGPARNVKIKCLTVTSLVQTGTHATFFGQAEINGVITDYRIDVDDIGEPGKGRDTFTIVTGSGYSAAGVLDGGNIQVHRVN